jgi:hypothetical protein
MYSSDFNIANEAKNLAFLFWCMLIFYLFHFTLVSGQTFGTRNVYTNCRQHLAITKNTKVICQGITGKQVCESVVIMGMGFPFKRKPAC